MSQESVSKVLIEDKCGFIYGKVFDRHGAVVNENYFTFKSNEFEETVRTNDVGNYKIRLPKGIYEITVNMRYSPNIYKRARLNVSCNDDIMLNIYAFPKILSHDSNSEQTPIVYFDSLSKRWVSNEKLDALIAYLRRRKTGQNVSYINAVFSYNNITISADKITKNFKSKIILAEGNVWLEDGELRADYDKLELRFTTFGVEIKGIRKISFNQQ